MAELPLRLGGQALVSGDRDWTLSESDVTMEFVASGGPGGQKVNRTASAVVLRFDPEAAGFPAEAMPRLRSLAGGRMGSDGVVTIHARRHRSQARNRKEAMERLARLLERALRPPPVRRPTGPTRGSKEERLRRKRMRSRRKRERAKGRELFRKGGEEV